MQLGWTDRATFMGLSLTIIGFTWSLHHEHKQDLAAYREDIKRSEEWYREDKKASDERWIKSDERWADLLGKFHDLDQRISIR